MSIDRADASADRHEHDLAQAVLDSAETLVLVLDGAGCVVRSNRAVERLCGRQPEEFVGRRLTDTLVAPECRAGATADLDPARSADYDSRSRGEHEWETAYGERRTVAWTTQVLGSGDSGLRVFTGIDVTGERRAQQRLSEVLDATTGVALIGSDPNGVITSFNPGAERMLGFTADEVIGGGTLAQFHDPDEIATVAAELGIDPGVDVLVHAALRSSEPDVRDWIYVCRDGVRIRVSLTVSVLRGPAGDVVGFLGVAEDVTERWKAEQTLMTALERERESVERLARLDRMRSEFVGSVSHELRTPLTSILGFTHLLEGGGAGALNPKQAGLLQRVERNGRRLLGLIEDLLTVSQMDTGAWEMAEDLVELREVIDAALADLDAMVADRDLDILLRIDEDLPTVVRGDRTQLKRVLVNLLSNAVKFTDDGGTVEVELTSLPDQLLLTVCDTGVGIPADELEGLFTRFFRATTAAAAAAPGSGLGLNIARSIVEQHGGGIVVTSVLAQGTLVEVSLPPAG